MDIAKESDGIQGFQNPERSTSKFKFHKIDTCVTTRLHYNPQTTLIVFLSFAHLAIAIARSREVDGVNHAKPR